MSGDPEKSAEAFRTISEAASELDLPQHVLRHWEDVFGHIRPMRRAGGRRYYRPYDLELLRGVRTLLYEERYTTKGVQKIFRENGPNFVAEIGRRYEAEIEANAIATRSEAVSGGTPLPVDTRVQVEAALLRLEIAQDALDDALIALDEFDMDDVD